MKAIELIEILQQHPPDTLLIMQSDSEGNSYSPLAGVSDNSTYVPDSTWSGEIYVTELTDDLVERGFTEDDQTDSDEGVPALVLYPIN